MSLIEPASALNILSGRVLDPNEDYKSFKTQLLLFAQRYTQVILREAQSVVYNTRDIDDTLFHIKQVFQSAERDVVRHYSVGFRLVPC